MGLLTRFKKMFSGEPQIREVEKVSVEVSFLPKWVDKHISYQFEKAELEVRDNLNDMKKAMSNLSDALEVLESATLQNDNIADRARTIMEGNRETFIKKHRSLIASFQIPSEFTFKSTIAFCKETEGILEELRSSTGKSNYVLNEFFSNQVSKVNRVMGRVAKNIAAIKEALDAKSDELETIDTARAKISDLLARMELEKQLYTQLQEAKASFTKTKDERDELSASVERFRNSDEYKQVNELDEKRAHAQNAVERMRAAFKQKFSPLSRPLKKYAHSALEHGKLVEQYSDDAATAFEADSNMHVVSILNRVKTNIENNSLDVKNKDKILKSLATLDKTFFETHMAELNALKEKKSEAERCMRASTAMRDFDELNYKLKHVEEKLDRHEQDIKTIEKKIEKQDVEGTSENVQELLSNTFNVDLTIVHKEEQ